ncbi:MAG: FecR domain-containing protein [Bdellovibrio sp.]|nr:FecR domain-containing protein [Bdellovibrio sp.]
MRGLRYICALGLISLQAYPYEFIVENIRGEAKLEPDGRILKINDELSISNVITTSRKSFVKIADNKGGVISLGPDSSIHLALSENAEISTINLLKGQIRATFNKDESGQYKSMIKTPTAALGVRGTDFHFIYNPDNHISTILTYGGKVEFVATDDQGMSLEEFEARETVKIPQGHISGVFTSDTKATEPIKISPIQFEILKNNHELKEGTGQKVTRAKESKSMGPRELSTTEDLAKKDSNLMPVPKKFIDDEYFEDKVKANPTIKSGGYLDLKTGIYVRPSDNSDYDAVNDVYYPPIEFGGIDEDSGEYVAPPGLILHPLKGFMFTTDIMQKGFHAITSTVNENLVTPIANTVGNVGNKGLDVIKKSATTIRDNTGVVGEVVGKGVALMGSGVGATLDIAENTSSTVLNTVANSLNSVVHDVFLTRISDIKEKTPIVKYFKIKFVQTFDQNHLNTDKYNMYDRYIERHNAVASRTNLDLKFQKSFYTNFFVRPHLEFKKVHMFGDDVNLNVFNQQTLYTGSDFGYSTVVKEMKYQTFFSVEKGKNRKSTQDEDNFLTHEDSWRFGFNKLLIGQKKFSTTLGYHFEKYYGPFDGKGRRHQLDISEILSASDTQFIRLLFNWNKVLQERYGDTHNWSTKLNFFTTTLKWNMNFEYWIGLRMLYDTGTIQKRGKENNYFAGTMLTKNFENDFSVQFGYELLKQTSPIDIYKYLSQQFTVGLGYIF